MRYRKYKFETEAAYLAAIEALQGQTKFSAVKVNCIQTPAVIVDGEVTEPAVIDPNFNVDIVWYDEEPESFVQYQVWPTGIGQHIIGGWEEQYEADRLAKFPV